MRVTAADAAFMARALRLAERGQFTTAPNPNVGCVLVRNGQIVGEGWHARAGEAHAEINALAAAGEAARGATAYVTLEPCNHQGRTGPCSEALIRAGISALVFAASDQAAPSQGGAKRLSEAGIDVRGGLMREAAEALNPGFHRRARGGLPWVRMKLAQSLDGNSALRNGQSQWITGPAARRDGHRWRARSCAMLTGIGTVLADDPQMSARPDLGHAVHQPLRVVLDTHARTPADARLRRDDNYLLVHGPEQTPKARAMIAPLHGGKLDLPAILHTLGQRNCNTVLVEAGAALSGAFLQAGLVDELIIYQAPSFLGAGRESIDLGMLENLEDRIALEVMESRRFGADSRIIARPLVKHPQD